MAPKISIDPISCHNEFDQLHSVLLCSPQFMRIREAINHTQRQFINENIDTDLAFLQHQELINTLHAHQVETVILPALEKYPEQVFTRDIGFVIGNMVFIAQLDHTIRHGEEKVLKRWLKEQQISFIELSEGSIEGGDILLDHQTIWVGKSDRTSQSAIDQLQRLLPEYEVMRVPFAKKYLHLDCVFNPISNKEALFFPAAFSKETLKRLANRYELIEVSSQEQFTLGTNVLSIGQKRIISLPINQQVNDQLKKRGYRVIEVDISEIIKSGGAFRCVTLPLVRVNNHGRLVTTK